MVEILSAVQTTHPSSSRHRAGSYAAGGRATGHCRGQHVDHGAAAEQVMTIVSALGPGFGAASGTEGMGQAPEEHDPAHAEDDLPAADPRHPQFRHQHAGHCDAHQHVHGIGRPIGRPAAPP
jgi:hypothetical protein